MVLGELPSYTQVFRALLGELYDDLPGRVSRLKLLAALDEDFGGSGVMLPGGHPTYLAYIEARSAFVSGAYLSVILLAQALVENLFGTHLVLDGNHSSHSRWGASQALSGPQRPSIGSQANVACLASCQLRRSAISGGSGG